MSTRIPSLFALFALFAWVLAACGGGDGGGRVPDMPAEVVQVDFSLDDGETVHESSYLMAPGDTWAEATLEFPDTTGGTAACVARSADGTALYRGVTLAQVMTSDVTVVVDLADASDTTPPEFGGAVTATVLSDTEVEFTWDPATEGGVVTNEVEYWF